MGFNFNRISIEKKGKRPAELKINTNVDVDQIKELNSDLLKTKEIMLGINFSYDIDYSPGFAKIELSGNALISVDSKTAKKVLKQWKNKEMPEDFRVPLFNLIISKSSVKALQLEEEMALPYHIPLPRVNPQDKSVKKK